MNENCISFMTSAVENRRRIQLLNDEYMLNQRDRASEVRRNVLEITKKTSKQTSDAIADEAIF